MTHKAGAPDERADTVGRTKASRLTIASAALLAIGVAILIPLATGVDDDRLVVPVASAPTPAVPTLVPTPTTTPDPCTVRVDAGVTRLDDSAGLGPGDVVCLQAGPRTSLEIFDLYGAPGRAITIVNEGGKVEIVGEADDYAGIDIQRSEHVRITGTGTSHSCGSSVEVQECGIVISGTGRGVAATNRAGHIEVDHLEIFDTSKSGVFMRTSEKNGVRREDWQQEETRVHHLYVHGTGTEGLYIGSSSYSDGADPVLVGVDIGYNLITDTGWDGLQVGSAVATCIVHHNQVSRAGLEHEDNQDSGLIINRGSVCDVAENRVIETAGVGIYVQGNGGNRVYNNLVVGASALVDDPADGIVASTGSNTEGSIYLWHNTIVSAGRSGISFRNSFGDDNQIANNLIVGWGRAGDDIDIRPEATVAAWANLAVRDLDEALLDADFMPMAGSPAIDAGAPIGFEPLFVDLLGWRRPQGGAADAGAIEHQPVGTS